MVDARERRPVGEAGTGMLLSLPGTSSDARGEAEDSGAGECGSALLLRSRALPKTLRSGDEIPRSDSPPPLGVAVAGVSVVADDGEVGETKDDDADADAGAGSVTERGKKAADVFLLGNEDVSAVAVAADKGVGEKPVGEGDGENESDRAALAGRLPLLLFVALPASWARLSTSACTAAGEEERCDVGVDLPAAVKGGNTNASGALREGEVADADADGDNKGAVTADEVDAEAGDLSSDAGLAATAAAEAADGEVGVGLLSAADAEAEADAAAKAAAAAATAACAAATTPGAALDVSDVVRELGTDDTTTNADDFDDSCVRGTPVGVRPPTAEYTRFECSARTADIAVVLLTACVEMERAVFVAFCRKVCSASVAI